MPQARWSNVGAKRILIVDGDGDSRAVYRIMLEYRGFEVVEAADVLAALDRLAAVSFDVVVTELTLRDRDGHEFVASLRQQRPEVCVVVLTARALQEDRTRALAAGCARYLTKPLEPQQLVQEIGGLVGG